MMIITMVTRGQPMEYFFQSWSSMGKNWWWCLCINSNNIPPEPPLVGHQSTRTTTAGHLKEQMQPWWINIQKGALRCWETVPKWFSVFDRFPWNLIFFIRFKREARKFKFREVVHFHWIWKKTFIAGSFRQPCSMFTLEVEGHLPF